MSATKPSQAMQSESGGEIIANQISPLPSSDGATNQSKPRLNMIAQCELLLILVVKQAALYHFHGNEPIVCRPKVGLDRLVNKSFLLCIAEAIGTTEGENKKPIELLRVRTSDDPIHRSQGKMEMASLSG